MDVMSTKMKDQQSSAVDDQHVMWNFERQEIQFKGIIKEHIHKARVQCATQFYGQCWLWGLVILSQTEKFDVGSKTLELFHLQTSLEKDMLDIQLDV